MRDRHDREIATMFDRIAARYDFPNRVLSFGTDIAWRRCALDLAGIAAGMIVLDIGADTGDLSFAASASPAFARLYFFYFDRVAPALETVLGGDREAYRYLRGRSVRRLMPSAWVRCWPAPASPSSDSSD